MNKKLTLAAAALIGCTALLAQPAYANHFGIHLNLGAPIATQDRVITEPVLYDGQEIYPDEASPVYVRVVGGERYFWVRNGWHRGTMFHDGGRERVKILR